MPRVAVAAAGRTFCANAPALALAGLTNSPQPAPTPAPAPSRLKPVNVITNEPNKMITACGVAVAMIARMPPNTV